MKFVHDNILKITSLVRFDIHVYYYKDLLYNQMQNTIFVIPLIISGIFRKIENADVVVFIIL